LSSWLTAADISPRTGELGGLRQGLLGDLEALLHALALGDLALRRALRSRAPRIALCRDEAVARLAGVIQKAPASRMAKPMISRARTPFTRSRTLA
jgi:hypothetical protein